MLSVRLSYVVSNMRNEMKCLSVSVIRGFQYEEWNEMSVRLSHTWIPIWGMKWNVCPSQSYVVSNMRNEMKCLSVSVIRGFQYEEWNEMSVRLSYVVSNMRNDIKCCLSVSVIRGFQYEEWNEMFVRLSYMVSNIRNEIKCLSVSVIRGFQYEEWKEMSVCHRWFPIWGMKWNVCPSQSYLVSNMRNEMKCMSVCHTWIPTWGITKSMSVCHRCFPIWGMKCLSVCQRCFPIWGMKWNVCPSVISGFQYEEWNEMSVRLSHSGFQYEECNEMSVRLSYVVSNMRNEMKCLSVCHTWFRIWGMKWNVCPSLIRGFQYEEWMNCCLSVCYTWFPIWGMKWNDCPSVIRGFQY